MTRRLAQQAVIVACAAILLLAPLATAFASQASGYHWARKVPQFTLRAGNNVGTEWSGIFGTSISEWNKNDTVTMKQVTGSGNPQNCPPSGGIIEVCTGSYGVQEGWLGLTRLFFNSSGDHIESVTVQMNDSFLFGSNSEYNSEAARRHTMCHELGHALGLAHVNTNSCMNDSQQAVFNNLTPTKKDFAELARIYQHKDSSTTVAGGQKKVKDKGKKGGKGNKRNKGNKGKKKQGSEGRARTRRGQTQAASFFAPTSLPAVPSGLAGSETVTVETLSDGRKMVTFISWAGE